MPDYPYSQVFTAGEWPPTQEGRAPYALVSYAFTGSDGTVRKLTRQDRAGRPSINYNDLALPEVTSGGLMNPNYHCEPLIAIWSRAVARNAVSSPWPTEAYLGWGSMA